MYENLRRYDKHKLKRLNYCLCTLEKEICMKDKAILDFCFSLSMKLLKKLTWNYFYSISNTTKRKGILSRSTYWGNCSNFPFNEIQLLILTLNPYQRIQNARSDYFLSFLSNPSFLFETVRVVSMKQCLFLKQKLFKPLNFG